MRMETKSVAIVFQDIMELVVRLALPDIMDNPMSTMISVNPVIVPAILTPMILDHVIPLLENVSIV